MGEDSPFRSLSKEGVRGRRRNGPEHPRSLSKEGVRGRLRNGPEQCNLKRGGVAYGHICTLHGCILDGYQHNVMNIITARIIRATRGYGGGGEIAPNSAIHNVHVYAMSASVHVMGADFMATPQRHEHSQQPKSLLITMQINHTQFSKLPRCAV